MPFGVCGNARGQSVCMRGLTLLAMVRGLGLARHLERRQRAVDCGTFGRTSLGRPLLHELVRRDERLQRHHSALQHGAA